MHIRDRCRICAGLVYIDKGTREVFLFESEFKAVWNPGGGELPYESDGDARRKIRINTLKETNLGVAPALFNP